ncbi:class I SAM-dependent methyltransferase [Lewinella sp. LCG006]|uniref:class I SAM-dependent methyltransferase n=1 Tax=Lewinella sp. LCG006 TaxID=3231911 RepID=UPI00345FE445
MKVEYDNYYQTEDLFGAPYPELIAFYASMEKKGRLLDVGCGQGRDAIALAKLGYEVVGIDYSEVGIGQLNEIAKKEKLPLKGIVLDMYSYSDFDQFEYILLNSMFHFGKKEREQESELLEKIIEISSPETLITICIQKTGKKVEVLHSIYAKIPHLEVIQQKELTYRFEDKASKHSSETKYEMITLKKLKKS